MANTPSHASRYGTAVAFLPALVLGLLWLALVAWRPFLFGFYHDDWNSVALPLSRSASLPMLLAADPGRPLYIVILYALRALLTDNVGWWQALLALVHLLNALAICRLVFHVFVDEPPAARRLAGTIAGAFWLVFPWSLGYSAWAIMLPPDIGLLLAILGVTQVMRPTAGRKSLALALLLLGASWLIYESTWLMWLPFSLLMLARSRWDVSLRSMAWRFFGTACTLQLLFIVANRVISAHSTMGKKLSVDILAILDTDRHLLLNQLLPSLHGEVVIGACFVLLLGALLLNVAGWLAAPLRPLALVTMLFGLALSVMIYAAAGYGIEWIGLFSRVTLPLSFWASLIFASLFMLAWIGASRYQKAIVLLSLLGIMLPFSSSLIEQSKYWSKSWDEQKSILAALPSSNVARLNYESILLVDIPRGTPPVFTFSAYWDVSGAVVPRIENFVYQEKLHAFASVLRKHEWRTTWDGKVVRQYWCTAPDSVLWEMDATQVYMWVYPAEQATAMSAAFDIGCDASK